MTPHSFDAVTAREMLGDERGRLIEAKARADADLGQQAYAPPRPSCSSSYWSGCQAEFVVAVYYAQFHRRLQRNSRKQHPR